ncbi:MAG: ketopantoate reductase family protein [Streptosporangiales bacterium]|nr:ketopantoate reductase family protein [Streptosporangiales bacterium]
MNFVIIGAGAVGGVVGARLQEAGYAVTFVARGAHLAAMAADGLRVESPAGTATLDVRATDDLRTVDWTAGPVALVAVKSQQLPAVLTDLASAAPPETPVVCLQNGVANEPAALRLFSRVYGVNVNCPATFLEPGVVQAWSTPVTGLLDIGRYPGGVDDVARDVAAAFRASTFDAYAVEDIMRWKHRKLLTNLRNAVDAACGPGEQNAELAARALTEGEAVLTAAARCFASRDEDRTRRADLLELGDIDGRIRGGSSTWQSLQRATGDAEADYLNGEIVLLGRLHGVPTPANAALQHVTRQLAVDHRPPGSIPAADILAQLHG